MKKVIKIKLDYLHGPIWKDRIDLDTGISYTGIHVIDNDETLQELDMAAMTLYSSFYHFDNPEAFEFHMDKEQGERLLHIMEDILKRLDEINDGTFVVEDEETTRLMEKFA